MARIFSNATNQKLVAPSSTVLNLGTSDFTVAVWVLRSIVGANDTIILGKRNWDNGVGWELKIRDATNRTIRFDVQTATTARQRAEGAIPNLNDGAWHLLIGRRATASYLDLWADNALIQTTAVATTGSVDNALDFNISGSPNQATRAFDGWIAEPAIFRRILSTEEMTELFKRFSPYFKRPSIHFPLIGRASPEPDVWGGSQAALVNAPTTGNHLRIHMPTIGQAPFPGETQALAGIIAGQSATAGILSATVPVAGSIDGTSTTAGILSASVPVAGSIDGTSTTAGILSATVPVAGSVDGASATAGILSATVPVAGSVDGASTTDGFLSAAVPVAGSVDGASSLDGSWLRLNRGFWATLAGLGDFAGWLIAEVPVAGILTATSDLPSKLDLKWRISGLLHGDGIPVGFLSATLPIKGIIAGLGSLDGFLSAAGPGLDGAVRGTSAILGKLSATVPLAGSLDAVSTVSPILTRIRWFAATLSGSVTLSGSLRIRYAERGIVVGKSQGDGALIIHYGLRGLTPGFGLPLGRLTFLWELRGECLGVGELAGSLSAIVDLAGQCDSASSLIAYLRKRFRISGLVSATSAIDGDLLATAWLRGLLSGQSELEGLLSKETGLRGLLEGLSSLIGRLRIAGELEQTNVGGRVVVRPENGVGGFVARWYRGEP